MSTKRNPIGWIEIPVTDLSRAATFYETVFQFDVQKVQFGDVLMGWLPSHQEVSGASGALVQFEKAYKPSLEFGPVVYFSSADVNDELSRVEAAGGTVLQQKTQISEDIGYMALIRDTEGNRIAIHSRG
jgi:predicted enzyme related to lactoylglutathione lyase